ncbi:hypothetical protein ANO14919_091200 [Xylariales sp. No.14919]|nr:hypothetical protein ANO14919_091200 [Xylariales sp. No.14919]
MATAPATAAHIKPYTLSKDFYLACTTKGILDDCVNTYDTWCDSYGGLHTRNGTYCISPHCICQDYRVESVDTDLFPVEDVIDTKHMLIWGEYELLKRGGGIQLSYHS